MNEKWHLQTKTTERPHITPEREGERELAA